MRVLIVDDESLIRMDYEILLSLVVMKSLQKVQMVLKL